MTKKSSIQIFPINLFVKETYHVVKILHEYNKLRRITGYWYEAAFVISLKENIVFVKLFETSFVSNIIASFSEFQCHSTDTFGFFQLQVLEIHIQGNFLHK